MCYVDHSSLKSVVKSSQFRTHCYTKLSIEVRKRFIEQEYLRVTNDSTTYSNTLSLSTRESLWLTIEILSKVKLFCSIANTAVDFSLVHLTNLQSECHIIINSHMWIKSVVLEYHGDITILWRNVVHFNAINEELTFSNIFQTSNHTESC